MQHPHIVPVLAAGEADGTPWFTMPYVEGHSLRERLRGGEPVPVREAVRVLQDVAAALAYAHARGVVHRDVKPDNILLDRETGRALVTDFGIAQVSGPGGGTLTGEGLVMGTAQYMSPEQAAGEPLDGRSDLYALAILAFELFTGELPFEGKSAQDTMISRLRGQPKSLRGLRPELPQRLEQVLHRALSLAPDDRYASMEEFAFALEHAASPGLIRRFFRRG